MIQPGTTKGAHAKNINRAFENMFGESDNESNSQEDHFEVVSVEMVEDVPRNNLYSQSCLTPATDSLNEKTGSFVSPGGTFSPGGARSPIFRKVGGSGPGALEIDV